MLQPESDKFQKLMLKRQKREKRRPKNVLGEYKSEDIAAAVNQDYDVDSVLMALGEVEDKVKREEKKKKSRKGKADHKKQSNTAVEVDKRLKDTEEAERTTGSERVFGFDDTDTEDIASKIGGMDLSKVVVKEKVDKVDSEEPQDAEEAESETATELGALTLNLRRSEARLHELLKLHMNLIESKGKEMSKLISKLDEAEDDRAALEKEAQLLDKAERELQDKKEKLASRTRDSDEKVLKIKKKKDKLERFLDIEGSRHSSARQRLEQTIGEIKTEIDKSRQVGESSMPERGQSEKLNLNLEWLDSIERKIADKEKELECPICLEVAFVPIYCCEAQHVICSLCRPKVNQTERLLNSVHP